MESWQAFNWLKLTKRWNEIKNDMKDGDDGRTETRSHVEKGTAEAWRLSTRTRKTKARSLRKVDRPSSSIHQPVGRNLAPLHSAALTATRNESQQHNEM